MSARRVVMIAMCAAGCGLAAPASGQTLEDRLDEAAFLRGLIELELPEVLDHYSEAHPPADAVGRGLHEIAGARIALRAAARDGDEPARRAALDRVLTLRRALIDGHPSHGQRALWLADQASDLFFELLPTDATELTAMWGRPNAEQRALARRAAREMNAAATLAELEIERVLLDLEETPGFATDDALQARRRRLARGERERRIPFLRGVAACLHAELNELPEDERTELWHIAAELLPGLAETLEGALADRASLYAGRVLARLGGTTEAEARFQRVIDRADAHPTDRFAARLGLVLLREIADGPETAFRALDAIDPGPTAVFFHVLLADRRFELLGRMADAADGAAARRLRRESYGAYLALLDANLGVSRDTMRAIVFRKLATAAGPDAPLDELPAIVAVARADRVLREEQDAPRALALLEGAVGRRDLDGREEAAILFGLGHALYEANRPLAAARRFTELAEKHPSDSDAERAIELAATIARAAERRAPRDVAARDQLRATLALLLARYPTLPTIDRWRYVAGRLAMEDGDLDRARSSFGQVPPDADEALDAAFMGVAVLRTEARAASEPGRRAEILRRLEPEARAAAATIQKAWSGVDADRKEDLRYYIARLRVMRAEAALELHAPDRAVEALGGIEREPGLDPEVLAAALRLRIEAYRALDRPAAVRDEVEAFLAAAPDHAAGVLDSILAAQLREIEAALDAGRPDAARTLAVTECVPVAELVTPWVDLGRIDEARGDDLLRRAADGLRHAGRYADALVLYDRLAVRHGAALEVILGRAECLFGRADEGPSDGLGDAMRLYRRVVAAGPDLGRTSWWQAQLRQLEILDRAGRNTSKIAPRIESLRMEHPDLGGPRFKAAFQRLERKYAS